MDNGIKGERKTNPKEKANLLEIVTFFFTYEIFKKGIRKELTEADIYDILKDYRSEELGDQLEKEWEKEKKRTTDPSVFRMMMRCYGKTYISYGTLQLVMKTILIIISPLSMGKLVSYFTPGQTRLTRGDACFYAVVTIGTNFLYFVYSHSYMLLLTQLGVKVRAAFCSLLYRKALKLTATSLGEVTTGKIVTLITKDVHSFDTAILFGNDLWIGVIQTAMIGYLMYSQIGISAIIGLAIFITMIPLQLYFGKRISIYRIKTAGKTDERLRATQEALSAIKIIKMYTWERFFAKIVDICRKYEIHTLRKIYYLKAISLSLGTLSSKLSFYVCVMCYIYFGNLVTAQKAFVVLSCYHTLRSTLTIYIPLGISQMAELRSALQRIKHVLTAAEAATDRSRAEKTEIIGKPHITINKACVCFENKKILEGLMMELGPGLTSITGNVGSGKTALLSLILNDLTASEGSISVEGTIAYASQEPWLFPGTIRQNILFGQPYNKERYDKVIDVCCLRTDLEYLPHGENTLTGDRGLNLSKGQQARVNLARSVYKDCDIYLLDDCLSALDAHVSKHVFNECIKGFLKDKICILVTHQMLHLQQSDTIIILNQGLVENIGTYAELEKKGANLKTINVNENMKEYQVENGKVPNEGSDADESSKLLVNPNKTVYAESKREGNVDKEVYKRYFSFGGGYSIAFGLFVMFIVAQVSSSYSDILVARWVDVEQNISNYKMKNLTNTSTYDSVIDRHAKVVNMYTVMMAVATVFTLGRAFSFFLYTTRASVRLHKAIFNKILGASMQFFDTHLLGNVLNRFSRDLGMVDESIPYIIFDSLRIFFTLVGIVYVVCSVNLIFIVPTCIFAVILVFVRKYYLPTSRSLKRLEGVTRSPLIGHLSASLEGLPTIRASKAQKILQEEFDKHQDLFNSVFYMYMTTSRAFGFFMDFLCFIYIAIITTTFLTIDTKALAGKVGLALTQAFSLTGMLQWGIRQWAELENQMTSVERLLEYSTVTPENRSGRRPDRWPSSGRIEYKSVNLTYYTSNNLVLKDLSFVIEPNQKIGIVGRTGAGKSSIIATLFRLYDIEGTITIDDEDIKNVAVEVLRSRISIIPQDPVLFCGTIRENLDPHGEHSDIDLWKALEEVKLKESLPNLQYRISGGGGNFSAGQRQLICLARAIIRKNKILVLDEATANVDPLTDALIQKTIKEKFSNCTVLTIAHRLDTVMNSDKVMVINAGSLVEFDAPENLLRNKDSAFYNMVKQAGLSASKED